MKKILILFMMLPLLIGVTIPVYADEVVDGELTIVASVEYENMPLMGLLSPTAVCKSMAHKILFIEGDDDVAWTKLRGINACWSACGVSIDDVKRAHWVLPGSGYSWTWGLNLIGSRSCKFNSISRYTYDYLHTPYPVDYWTHQSMFLKYTKPLKFGWAWWTEPVIPGQ